MLVALVPSDLVVYPQQFRDLFKGFGPLGWVDLAEPRLYGTNDCKPEGCSLNLREKTGYGTNFLVVVVLEGGELLQKRRAVVVRACILVPGEFLREFSSLKQHPTSKPPKNR